MQPKTIAFLAVFLLFSAVCSAQKNKGLGCKYPKPTKEKVIVKWNNGYVSLELGLKQAFLYRNKQGNLNDGYSFNAKPKQYLGITYIMPVTSKFEVFLGAQHAQNKQGLVFNFNENGDKIIEKNYSISTLFRFGIGGSFFINPSWKFSICPILLHSTYVAAHTTGSYQFDVTKTTISRYDYLWDEENSYKAWYAALDLKSNHRIYKRLYLDVIASLDFMPSVPISGEAYLTYQNGAIRSFQGSIKPYLLYLGGGLSYRIF